MHCVLRALDTTDKEGEGCAGVGEGGGWGLVVMGSVWGLSYLTEIIQQPVVRLCYPLSAPGADR